MIQLHEIHSNPFVVFDDNNPISACELVFVGSEATYDMPIFPELVKSRKVHTFRCVADASAIRHLIKHLESHLEALAPK